MLNYAVPASFSWQQLLPSCTNSPCYTKLPFPSCFLDCMFSITIMPCSLFHTCKTSADPLTFRPSATFFRHFHRITCVYLELGTSPQCSHRTCTCFFHSSDPASFCNVVVSPPTSKQAPLGQDRYHHQYIISALKATDKQEESNKYKLDK